MTDIFEEAHVDSSRRSFANLLTSTSVSSFGAAISIISVNWIVYHYTHSSIDISYVGLTGIIPGIIFGIFAGVLADKYNRRKIMVLSDLFRMTFIGILSLSLYFFGFSLVLILVTMLIVNSFSSLFLPASQAIIPRIIKQEGLEHANGLLQSMQAGMISIGSAAGGIIVTTAGASLGLGINAMTYALSALFLVQISGEFGKIVKSGNHLKEGVMHDIGVGFRYMKENKPILEITLGFLPVNFFAALVETFLVVYAAMHFPSNAPSYGYLVAGITLGIVLGSITVERIHARKFAGWLMGLCIFANAAGIYVLVISQNEFLAIIGSIILGLAIGLINTTFLSTIQALVPNEFLARVMSVDSVGSMAAVPAGIAAGGILIATYGINMTFIISAAGMALVGGIVLSMKGFRNVKFGG